MYLTKLALCCLLLALALAYVDNPIPKIDWEYNKQNFHEVCQDFSCPKQQLYNQSSLTLSWPGEFCFKYNRCAANWHKHWDRKSFGIHGYWPSFGDSDLSCVFGKKCPDPFCTYDFYFFSPIKGSAIADLEKDLEKYWPEYGTNNRGEFRQNEWNKHGVCYLKVLKELFPNKYTDQQLFRSYFVDTLEKTKRFQGKMTKLSFQNKGEFAAQLGIGEDNFYIDCFMKGSTCNVKEIRICYDMGEAGKEQLVDCFTKDLESEKYKKVELSMPSYLQNQSNQEEKEAEGQQENAGGEDAEAEAEEGEEEEESGEKEEESTEGSQEDQEQL